MRSKRKSYYNDDADIHAIRGELRLVLQHIDSVSGLEIVGTYLVQTIDLIDALVTDVGAPSAH